MRTRQAGFTLVELSLSMTVMLVALLTTSAANLRASSLQRQNREQGVAINVISSVVDRLRAQSERALELADPTNPTQTWAALMSQALQAGGSIGNSFDCSLLTPQGANGQVGAIVLVTSETSTDAGLGVDIGMPRDLDGDGQATNANVSQTARTLPVIITVAWRSQSGDHAMRHPLLLTGF